MMLNTLTTAAVHLERTKLMPKTRPPYRASSISVMVSRALELADRSILKWVKPRPHSSLRA